MTTLATPLIMWLPPRLRFDPATPAWPGAESPMAVSGSASRQGPAEVRAQPYRIASGQTWQRFRPNEIATVADGPSWAGQAPQRRRGARGLHIPVGVEAYAGAGSHQLSGRAGRSRSRRTLGAAMTRAWSWRWASPAAWTAERRAARRTDSAARGPVARGWASWSRPRASRAALV